MTSGSGGSPDPSRERPSLRTARLSEFFRKASLPSRKKSGFRSRGGRAGMGIVGGRYTGTDRKVVILTRMGEAFL